MWITPGTYPQSYPQSWVSVGVIHKVIHNPSYFVDNLAKNSRVIHISAAISPSYPQIGLSCPQIGRVWISQQKVIHKLVEKYFKKVLHCGCTFDIIINVKKSKRV